MINSVTERKILEFKEWSERKIGVIHMKRSPHDLSRALSEVGIPFEIFDQSESDMENRILEKSSHFCGIIIGGGKLEEHESLPRLSTEILDMNVPKLGICLGHEILGVHLGSELIDCNAGWGVGEGLEVATKIYTDPIFEGLTTPSEQMVKMEHFYMLDKVPSGAKVIASTKMTPVAGFHHYAEDIWGIQFHPEKDWMRYIILKNFYKICLNK
jgi:GMP synthase-like glutamine amidotransferase